MAQKSTKGKKTSAQATQKKAKQTKSSTVVVNGRRATAKKKNGFGLNRIFSQKALTVSIAIIFGVVGLYFLARSLAATTTTAATDSFNVTTWNSEYSNSGNVGKELIQLGTHSDIIAIQETHKASQRKNIKTYELCSTCKYAGYMPESSYFKTHDGSSPASLPIIWNKSKFSLVEKGNVKTSDKKTGINDSTGKNAKVSSKYLTWVRLRDKATGRSFYVINTHTVASVESGGSPNTKNSARLAIYKKNIDAVVAKINTFKKAADRPIIVMGDFNVNYRYDIVKQNALFPYKKFSALGVHSTYERLNLLSVSSVNKTEGNGNRLIDYVFTLTHNRMTVNNEYIDSGTYGSDHHPVSATLTIFAEDPTKTVTPASIPIGTANPSTTDGVTSEDTAVKADAYGDQ